MVPVRSAPLPPAVPQSRGRSGPAQPHAGSPLLFDPDNGLLVQNAWNKTVVDSITLAFNDPDTDPALIRRIIQNAVIDDYTYLLRTIVLKSGGPLSALSHTDLETIGVHQTLYADQQQLEKDRADLEADLAGKCSPGQSEPEPAQEPEPDASAQPTCNLKLPTGLLFLHPDAIQQYQPIFYQALARQEFAKKIEVVHGSPKEPNPNHYNPGSQRLQLCSSQEQLGRAVGNITHELSHARDYLVKSHQSVDRGTTATSIQKDAEALYSTEIKAWLLEAMQAYVSHKAGLDIPDSQQLLIDGFNSGHSDILQSSTNQVHTRLDIYRAMITSHPDQPVPPFNSLFQQEDAPISDALERGTALFLQFKREVDKGEQPDPENYLKALDKIFHDEFYRIPVPGTKQDNLNTLKRMSKDR